MKILTGVVAILLVVVATLGFQLRSAHGDVAQLTLAVGGAQQDASNARSAQKTAEQQNAILLAGFAMLDTQLKQLGVSQKANADWLSAQLAGLNQIQQSPGDSNESFSCLDTAVPAQLDHWLRDDNSPTGADGRH